jgi:hypothetical protein
MQDRWERPVTVCIEGGTRDVSNTMDAADCIFECCRGEGGAIYDSTMRSFAQVFDGRQPPSSARDAFVKLIEASPSIQIVSRENG